MPAHYSRYTLVHMDPLNWAKVVALWDYWVAAGAGSKKWAITSDDQMRRSGVYTDLRAKAALGAAVVINADNDGWEPSYVLRSPVAANVEYIYNRYQDVPAFADTTQRNEAKVLAGIVRGTVYAAYNRAEAACGRPSVP